MDMIEDVLWDLEDVVASEDEEWDPEQVELRLLQALPRISWSMIRATIRVVRDAFATAHEEALRKKEEEARAQEAAAAQGATRSGPLFLGVLVDGKEAATIS